MAQHKKQLDRLWNRISRQKANQQEQSFFWQWLWQLNVRERSGQINQEEKEQLARRLWAAIDHKTQELAPVHSSFSRKYFPAAAAVIAVAIAGWLWMRPPVPKREAQLYVFASDAYNVRQLVLPDSTVVVLNRGSSLQYTTAYNDSDRRVTLQGEGYFTVHENSRCPFIVMAGGLEIQALGTAFNIEARDQETQTRVALTEGSVAVMQAAGRQAQKSILQPGQLLRYERAGRQFTTTAFTTDVTAWTTGGLSFNGIPLAEALNRLSTHYGLKLRYNAPKLAGLTVTASFHKTSWENALSSVLFAHDLSYVVKDSCIFIK